jgi:hypothetical protein
MKPSLFLSYSRQQTPFVDRFADHFEDQGHPIWLDYQRLIPARPWMEQIENGIMESDVFLLVVSRDSIASKNVEPEWRLALQLNKRIVLVIFEACPLPGELQDCEWVDFRSGYRGSLQHLKMLIEAPQAGVKSAPPQSGFKASISFWLAMFLSVLVLIGSMPAWWTILVPYILVPLPWGIYKRNYVFSRVVPILLLLPVFTTFSASFFTYGGLLETLQPLYIFLLYPTFLTSGLLLLLLFTPAIQRRVLPQAARVQFANPFRVDVQTPRPILFSIDHAAEDGRYAEDLARGLEKYGHRFAADGEQAEASFVLISTYKKQTTYDPDHQAVYPIILQAVDEIEPALQRIQWIDFRSGAKHLDKLARLLPEPQRLLKALAVPPTGMQEIFPLSVNALQYFFAFTGMIGAGGLLISAISFVTLILRGDVGMEQVTRLTLAAVNGALLIAAVLYSLRGLRSRRHGTAAIYPLIVLTVFQFILQFINVSIIAFSNMRDANLEMLLTSAAIGSILTFLIFPVAFILVLPILLFRWSELSRWFPRPIMLDADRLETLFLLYRPSSWRALIFQIIFHILMMALYFFFFVYLQVPQAAGALPTLALLFLIAMFFRWMAVRRSR